MYLLALEWCKSTSARLAWTNSLSRSAGVSTTWAIPCMTPESFDHECLSTWDTGRRIQFVWHRVAQAQDKRKDGRTPHMHFLPAPHILPHAAWPEAFLSTLFYRL